MAPCSHTYRIGSLAIVVALVQFVSSDEVLPDSHEWTEAEFQRLGQVSDYIRTIWNIDGGSLPACQAYNKWINDHIGKDNPSHPNWFKLNFGKDNRLYQFDVNLSDVIRDLFRYKSDYRSSNGYDPQVAGAIKFFGVTFEDVVSGGDHGLTSHIIKLAGSKWMTDSFAFIARKMKQEGKSPSFESFLASFESFLASLDKDGFKELFCLLHCMSNHQQFDYISADTQDRIARMVHRVITADQDLVAGVVDGCHDRLALILINTFGYDWLVAHFNHIYSRIFGPFMEHYNFFSFRMSLRSADPDHRFSSRCLCVDGKPIRRAYGEGSPWYCYDNEYQQSMRARPSAVSPHDQELQRLYSFLHEKLEDVSIPAATRKGLGEIEHRCAVLAYIEEQDRIRSRA